MIKPYNRPGGRGKNRQTTPLARGNTPLLPPSAASSPEGQILAALCFEMLMRTNAERREDFPRRVEVPPQAGIGVHFLRAESPVVMAFPLHLFSMVLFSCIFF